MNKVWNSTLCEDEGCPHQPEPHVCRSPNEVWTATVDGRYECRVLRTESYRGELLVRDKATGEERTIKPVTLSFDALFGPDVMDVADWQDAALTFIDEGGI